MTEPTSVPSHSESTSAGLVRRSFLAATVGAVGLAASNAFGRDYGPHAQPVRYPDPDIVTLDPRFKKYALGNTPIQRIYHSPDMLWAEGPAWNGVGKYLLWSDIPNNVQMRWLEEDGHVSTFRHPAGNSNGNTFDHQGRQISFEHGNRRVLRYEFDGSTTVLADKFDGKPLNAPNDGAVHPNGDIWFTDPGYGSLMNYEGEKSTNNSKQPNQKEAVYRIDGKTLKVEKVTDEIFKPNGLCFSPDYKKLYVADTGASHYDEAPKNIKVWDIVDEKKLSNGKEFASMKLNWSIVDRKRWPGIMLSNTRGLALPTEFDAISMETSGPVRVGWAMVMTEFTSSNPKKAFGSARFGFPKSAVTFALEEPSEIACS